MHHQQHYIMCYINAKLIATNYFCVTYTALTLTLEKGFPTGMNISFTISVCLNMMETVLYTTNSPETTITFHKIWIERLYNLVT